MTMDASVQQKKIQGQVRFDIITYLVKKGKWNRKHIEDAFYFFGKLLQKKQFVFIFIHLL